MIRTQNFGSKVNENKIQIQNLALKIANGIVPDVRRRVSIQAVEKRFNGIAKTTDNHDNNALTHICSHAARHGIATGMVPSVVEAIAEQNPYNPVADWIKGKAWDGLDRLPFF